MSKRIYWVGGTAVFIIAVAFGLYFALKPTPIPTPVYTDNAYLRYGFLLKNESNKVVENAEFSMFAPYQNTEKQQLVGYTSNPQMLLDADENGRFSFKINDLLIPPYGSKNVTVTIEMATSGNQAQVQLSDKAKYLQNSHYLNMESPVLTDLAKLFAHDEPREVAKKIYVWLVNNINVVGYVAEARGAEYAIKELKGDCTEMMHAFIALARLNNLPARAVGGFVVEGNSTVVHANDYHNWAEYYDGRRWVVVDPQNQVFDTLGNKQYIAFRYLDDDEGQQYSQRFVSFDPAISVSMM